MSATVSADGGLLEGETITVPEHEIEVRGGGERVRLRWWHYNRVRARALFHVGTDDDVIVLAALSAWPISQQPADAPDWDVSLDNIPDGLRLALRGAGYTLAEDGGADE